MQYPNSQKGIAPFIIVLVLAVVLAGVSGAYYFFKQQQAQNPSVLEETAKKILTQQEAVELVKSIPDVQAWLALFTGPDGTGPSTGGKPVIIFSHMEGEKYVIQAYEQTQTHTATFDWYTVDPVSWEIQNFSGNVVLPKTH